MTNEISNNVADHIGSPNIYIYILAVGFFNEEIDIFGVF
jgi:uncharacterized membrane protein